MKTIRCSELDRTLSCHGSLTLNALVAQRDGTEGDEGTFLHWMAHDRLVREQAATGDLGPTPEMPASVAFSAWIADYYYRFVTETAPRNWALEVEAALAYEWPAFTLSGHIDCFAISPDGTEAIGFDLKTGHDPVDIAEMNWQVLGYMVLLLRAYLGLRKITFWIVQPRNDEDEGFQRTSSVTLEGEALLMATGSLESEIAAAIADPMSVETGLKCCKWCSAAMVCPAQLKLREEMKATLTPELLEQIKATPDDALLGDWVISGKTINRPIEDAEKLLKERIKANGSVTAACGKVITLKTQGGAYSFPDPVAFYRATREILPDDDKYAATVKPSVSATKEAIAKVRGIPKTSTKKESAESVFDEKLRPLCTQGVREVMVFQ